MKAKQSLLRLALAGLAVLMTLVPMDGRCASAVHANSLDPDAEVLALEASGELLAPDALYQKMLGELTAIRAAYAAVSNIHARAAWVRGQLISERLTVRKKRCLRQQNLGQYKITRPPYSRGYRIITFTEHYNPMLLAALLHSTCGIVSGPNRYGGDGSDITYDNATGYYTFKRGWGDCPAGCTGRHYWVFSVNVAGQVTLVSESGNPLP